jgi:nucleoid-associated protein YgaU
MGQLEKYGLYVLCLVIFLILGVTIWGGPDVAPSTPRSPASPMRANGAEPTGSRENPPTAGVSAPVGGGESADLASLLDQRLQPTESVGGQEPKASDKSDKPVKPAAGNTAKPVDADASKESAPAAAADQKRGLYKVQAGDTFDSIARKRLGGAAMVAELQKLNPKIVPSKLQVGTELVLPSPAELAAKKVAPAVANAPSADKPSTDKSSADKSSPDKAIAVAGVERSYTIAKGDNFELIARRELGSARRVDELRDLNPALDPTRLKVGQRIKLPKK